MAVPGLLLVGMAVVQMVLVFHARQSVGYALQEAARAGAVEHAGEEAILKGLASGLVPWLYGAGSMAEKMLKEQQARLHVTGGRAAQWIEVKSYHLDNIFAKMIAVPGMWLQKITTSEPDESQLEVAIVALNVALGNEVWSIADDCLRDVYVRG